jgi:hypothetical protein
MISIGFSTVYLENEEQANDLVPTGTVVKPRGGTPCIRT